MKLLFNEGEEKAFTVDIEIVNVSFKEAENPVPSEEKDFSRLTGGATDRRRKFRKRLLERLGGRRTA